MRKFFTKLRLAAAAPPKPAGELEERFPEITAVGVALGSLEEGGGSGFAAKE